MLLDPCPSFHFVRGANNPCFCCFSLLASSCDFYRPLKVTRPCALLARRLWCPLSLLILLVFRAVFIATLGSFLINCCPFFIDIFDYRLFLSLSSFVLVQPLVHRHS